MIQYETAEMELVMFQNEDVITTSVEIGDNETPGNLGDNETDIG